MTEKRCPVCERGGDLERQGINAVGFTKQGWGRDLCEEHTSMCRGRRHRFEYKSQKRTITDRFMANVEKGDGCWEWTAGRQDGYGYFRIDYRTLAAHRVAHELFIGEIGDLHIHHICRNRGCVNPEHFELVTTEEHAQRHAIDHTRERLAESRGLTVEEFVERRRA